MTTIHTLIAEEIEKFVEVGADLEHSRWARWQAYMFSKMTEEEKFEEGIHFKTGNYILRKELVDRWFRQINTKYADLPESEKESDRKETRNYIPLLTASLLSISKKTAEVGRLQINDRCFVGYEDDPEVAQSIGYNAAITAQQEAYKEFFKEK